MADPSAQPSISDVSDERLFPSVGSAVALVIFLLVGIAGFRRRAETGSNAGVVVLAIATTAVVLVSFAVDTWRTAPGTFGAILVLAVLLDRWTRARARRGDDGAGPATARGG